MTQNFPCKTVEEFAQWYLDNRCPIRPPFHDAIYFTEMTASLCLFRHENYQVELYIVKPDMDCPKHSHPGVDSYFIYLTGHVEFGDKDGKYTDLSEGQKEGVNGSHALLGKFITALNSEDHSVRTGNTGGAYLSFEKWNDGFPDSVAVNWVGETVGDQHTSIITKEIEDGNINSN
jgi:hypothetical protein